MNYFRNLLRREQTPQHAPLFGENQILNSAGGYVWAVDDWTRLDRFLILGSEGGSFYATEQAITLENASAIVRCIYDDGPRAVERIAMVSEGGLAPKNDPALFALAIAAGMGERDTRVAAYAALPRVARIGTHLFHFLAYVQQFRGWGRGLRGAIAEWYNHQQAEALAFGVIKYRQRDGWSHRDALRLAHPKPASDQHAAIYHWITQGWPGIGDEPHPDPALRKIWAFEKAQRASSATEITRLIVEEQLPREAIPTQFLNDAGVWEALLAEMPIEAITRNLATMTRVGLLAPNSAAATTIAARLRDATRIKRARLHPVKVLAALLTYRAGKGARSDTTWKPVMSVVDALDEAFYLAFQTIKPSGKRLVLALDVSGSMTVGAIAGVPGLSPRVGSAAMALVTAATEPQHTIVGFAAAAGSSDKQWGGGDSALVPIAISPRQRLDDAVAQIDKILMGGTDCSLPMRWAQANNVEADAFIIYTDSETWAGPIHASEALKQYREHSGIAAKLVVVGMLSNGFTIADPNEAGMLDCVGFSTDAPAVIADFVR